MDDSQRKLAVLGMNEFLGELSTEKGLKDCQSMQHLTGKGWT
jgi:hypothetical protein